MISRKHNSKYIIQLGTCIEETLVVIWLSAYRSTRYVFSKKS